jgi:hypothetical protein
MTPPRPAPAQCRSRMTTLWDVRVTGRQVAVRRRSQSLTELPLPKRNYGYEKRQKELHKQQKREEKRQRKLDRAGDPPEDIVIDEPTPGSAPSEDGPS